jgi:GDP/UDP-N,N'-diacetylbacillosamine 2-epimerase (hydrolysing)
VLKRKIAVFTGNRAEFGLLYPVIQEMSLNRVLDVSLIISGSHLQNDFGRTIDEINTSCVSSVKSTVFKINNGTSIPRRVSEVIRRGDKILEQIAPDILVLAGDRYETFAIGIAAYYLNIPIAHIFGGDISQGGHQDDSIRHSLTKISHLHFVSNKDAYKRVINLGEEKWRVFNVGSTAMDNILSGNFPSSEETAFILNLDFKLPVIIFTQHPVTTESDQAYYQAKKSLQALKELGYQTVVTYPCNDSGSEGIIKAIKEYNSLPNLRIHKSLGWKLYLSLLKSASAVVGNSSSGIIETPAFKVPCVNIGTRQAGRLRSTNVIDVPYDTAAIRKAVKKAIHDKKFLRQVKKCRNPYGDGRSSLKIIDILKNIDLNRALLQKKITY